MRRLVSSAIRLFPASGGFDAGNVAKVIRLRREGCANRPFYHIVVGARKREQHDPCIEQVGSFDPMPNERNEKLVALNLERISYWIGQGASVSKPVKQILGISGFFPIHPRTYMTAWRNRRTAVQQAAAAAEKAANQETDQDLSQTSSPS